MENYKNKRNNHNANGKYRHYDMKSIICFGI